MRLARRKFLRLAAGTVALPAISHVAEAQAYPSRPITMIAPFAAGGPADVVARLLAERMRRSLGRAILTPLSTGYSNLANNVDDNPALICFAIVSGWATVNLRSRNSAVREPQMRHRRPLARRRFRSGLVPSP